MSCRTDLFDFIKGTDLYKLAKDDLDVLFDYMSVQIEEGSLAYLFGFKRVLAQYEDELPWLCGVPSWTPNPSLDEAVLRVKAMRLEYEDRIRSFMEILDQGVENELDKRLDMCDHYYVRLDSRDKSVDAYIDKKPDSLEEMNKLACSDLGFRLKQSAWREAYGDQFGLYFLREQVGFDRVQFNVRILSIDVDKLLKAKQDLRGSDYSSLPRIVIEYVDADDPNDFPMVLPLREHQFKKIEVTLSHHIQFVFQRNNSPLDDNGRRKRDIYLLKVTVVPQLFFEYLGNIGNYSYDELCLVVKKAFLVLRDLTGIELDGGYVLLNDVELNLTFLQNCDFNDLMRSVCYYQNYTRKGYVTREFKASDEELIHFCVDFKDCVTEDQFTKKKRRIRDKYSRMKTTGFTTSSQSVRLKLYDKKAETISYARSQGYDLKIEGDEAIIRLEFCIKNRDQLRRYFSTGDKDVNLWDLSQESLERAYINLVDIFFKSAYEDRYVPESRDVLIGIISSLDTSAKGGKWKQTLIKEILSQEIWQKSTPALLTEKDISDVIQYNVTFNRHPKKYKEILWNLLQESDFFKKGQAHAYDMLFNFLNKTYSLTTLSSRRRVGFAVAFPGEKLEDMDSKIDSILASRYLAEKVQNTDLDDLNYLVSDDRNNP